MRRFSKLKKRIESLFVPDLDMEVHCTVYRKKTSRSILKLPRLWITLNGEIIFDFIKDFKDIRVSSLVHYIDDTSAMVDYPVIHLDILFITDMIQEYIKTPIPKLSDREGDISNLLKTYMDACKDRRFELVSCDDEEDGTLKKYNSKN